MARGVEDTHQLCRDRRPRRSAPTKAKTDRRGRRSLQKSIVRDGTTRYMRLCRMRWFCAAKAILRRPRSNIRFAPATREAHITRLRRISLRSDITRRRRIELKKPLTFVNGFFFGAPGGIQAETARGSAPPFLFRRQKAGGDFAARNHKKRLLFAAFYNRTVRIPASQNKKPPGWVVFRFGAPGGIRTCDLPVRSRALYPLSYKRIQSVFRPIYISTTLAVCQHYF